ncbi:MAG: rhodanese-like domain-containing protein [Bacteroidota bacterium]
MIKIIIVFICTCLTLGVSAQQLPSVKKIEVASLRKKIVRNIQLVDVRTPKEYNEGRIGNAINIDFNAPDFEANIQKLNKNKRVYIYCRTGNRSVKASEKMRALGFRKLYVLPVGMEGWKKEVSN